MAADGQRRTLRRMILATHVIPASTETKGWVHVPEVPVRCMLAIEMAVVARRRQKGMMVEMLLWAPEQGRQELEPEAERVKRGQQW